MKHFYTLFILLFISNLSFSQVTELYFSKYGEGSSNNKFLEIYNGTDNDIDLSNYAYPSVANAPSTPGEYEFWNSFDEGAVVAAGDVYVIAHPSADAAILAQADETHSYLSNGDDGYALVSGTEDSYVVIDWLGDWNGDPGSGWTVAGIENATQNATLTRKSTVCGPNNDWVTSAGTNAEDSEWIVGAIDSGWDTIGSYDGCVSGPVLTITSPSDNQEFESGTTSVTVSISVDNFSIGPTDSGADGHIHWSVNGQAQAMKYDLEDETIDVVDGESYSIYVELVGPDHQPISPAINQTVAFSVVYPCDLYVDTISSTCDSNTSEDTDTYTTTFDYTGGGTTNYTIDTGGVGTVSGDDPSTVAEGTIVVSGVAENTDFVVTFTGDSSNSSCDFTRSISSPNCNPSLGLPYNDSFDYPDGSLISSSNWNNFSGTEGDLLVTEGKVLVQHGTPSEDAGVSFGAVEGVLYYAFDFSVNNPGEPISGGDYEYFAMFKDDGFSYRARIDIVTANNEGSDFTLGISSTGSTADTIWPDDLSFDTTYRVTVKYDQDQNIAQLWVNASSETDASILGDDESDPGTSITQFGLRQSDSSQNEGILIDNLSISQTFSETLSTDQILSSNQTIGLYPNPTNKGFVNITTNVSGQITVDVYDILGKVIISSKIDNNRLDVSNLKAGMYVIKIKQNDIITTKKLIIN
ncbi:MAG: T9SS type A sorting domain-containing protein [Flavobacteriaceae bacterium]